MKNIDKIVRSFGTKPTLNEKIWDGDKMKPNVRQKLLEISNEFLRFIDLDIIVSDIKMTGSLSNYNWSEYSDIDLHLIVDFTQFKSENKELYTELFNLKKTLFNEKHDITIHGYEVELYVENLSEEHFSSGVYSVMFDEWVIKPKKDKKDIDVSLLKNKVNNWMSLIDTLLRNLKGEPMEVVQEHLKQFKEKLKKYRTSGLKKDGEYSYENLVFKSLRRNGYIGKVFDFETSSTDKKLSIFEILNLHEVDNPKKADVVGTNVQELYKNLESIDEPLNQQDSGDYSYQKDVESVQIGLELLGYSLPVHGVDGLYGPETGAAVEKFKTDNGLNVEVTGVEMETEGTTIIKPPVNMEKINSEFGRRWGRFHHGVDIGVKSGTNISSPADGKVIDASTRNNDCGGTIFVKHADGYKTRYCHVKDIRVTKGDVVKQGDILGLSGGDSEDYGKGNSQKPHLHFEVYKDGKTIDPLSVINKNYIGTFTGQEIRNSTVTPETAKKMVEQLKNKDITEDEIKKYVDVVSSGGGELFTDLDLTTEEGYKTYEKICDDFIRSRSHNLLSINGKMIADAARNTYVNRKKYLPPQLVLAQLALEGGFSDNSNATPIVTKNPFNIGNTDSGNKTMLPSVEKGIQLYFDTMSNYYLKGGKTANDLLQNFVNYRNNRYASSEKYEKKLEDLVRQINKKNVSKFLQNT